MRKVGLSIALAPLSHWTAASFVQCTQSCYSFIVAKIGDVGMKDYVVHYGMPEWYCTYKL